MQTNLTKKYQKGITASPVTKYQNRKW